MSKLLVFSFDGTGNEPQDAQQDVKYQAKKEDDNISNVLKLHLMMGGNLHCDNRYGLSEQDSIHRCFYYQGVGTYGSWLQRILNLGLAMEKSDVASVINTALTDFNAHYQQGDIVLVTGFSRGAALARRFVTLIDRLRSTAKTPFVFLCVFDTVASIGLPNLSTASRPDYDVVFENGCTLSNIVIQATHMVSLDDKRRAFQPTLMNCDAKRITEIWFAGAHSDVGGGYYRDGLADLALSYAMKWIQQMSKQKSLKTKLPLLSLAMPDQKAINKACPAALKDLIGVDDLQRNPDPMGKNHQQDRWPIVDWLTLDDRVFCVIDNDKIAPQKRPLLHWSVPERLYRDKDYRPKSMTNVKHQVWYDFVTKPVKCDGYAPHIEFAKQNWSVLEPEQSIAVTVDADRFHNYTGVMMQTGEHYEITAAPGAVWFDRTIACGADGWDRDGVTLGLTEVSIKAMEPFRRVKKADWFALCGGIGTEDSNAKPFGSRAVFKPKQTGEFTLFANDLESRYGNNSGSIQVVIKRLA